MFELVTPHAGLHQSFLAAADEFIGAGERSHANLLSLPADDGFPGREYTRDSLELPDVFADFASFIAGQRFEASPRPAAHVPCTELWMTDGVEYLGRISLRHELTDLLLTWGGHIGFSVRPSARRRGYASRALAMMLPVCAELGIDPVLVTCDTDNHGSRSEIEKNGGVYEDTREGKLRFWVPTPWAAPIKARLNTE